MGYNVSQIEEEDGRIRVVVTTSKSNVVVTSFDKNDSDSTKDYRLQNAIKEALDKD